MSRFGWTQDELSGDDVIAVGVQDTYVDAGVRVAQVSWWDPADPDRRQTGLIEVALAEEMVLSRLMHRTLYVHRGDIQASGTRFDLDG